MIFSETVRRMGAELSSFYFLIGLALLRLGRECLANLKWIDYGKFRKFSYVKKSVQRNLIIT